MNTLYDILGIGRQATQDQIERAYKERLDSLKAEENADPKEGIKRLRVTREAYLQLSSPAKRQSYDAKLRSKEMAPHELADKKPAAWVAIILVCIALGAAGLYFYKSYIEKKPLVQRQLEPGKPLATMQSASQS